MSTGPLYRPTGSVLPSLVDTVAARPELLEDGIGLATYAELAVSCV